MDERPSRRFGTGLKALPKVRDKSKFSPEGPEWIGRPSRKSGRGQEALPEVWDGSKGPPGGLEQV